MKIRLYLFVILIWDTFGVHIKHSQPPPHRNELDLSTGKRLNGVINSTVESYYYLQLDSESVLDVLIIRVALHPSKTLIHNFNSSTTHEALHVLATNGHDSTSFSVPFILPNGNLVYDVGRHLNPIVPRVGGNGTMRPDQYLTVNIRTASYENVSYTLNWRRYDRAQYDIRFTKSKAVSLRNQKVSFPEPWTTRVTLPSSTDFAFLKISVRSADSLCGRLILANDDRNIYSASIFGSLADAGIQESRFTLRVDYVLPKEQLNEFLYIYILVDADDKVCDPAAKLRESSKNKKIDFVVSAEDSTITKNFLFSGIIPLLFCLPAAVLWMISYSTVKINRVAQLPGSSNSSVTSDTRDVYSCAIQAGDGEAAIAHANVIISEDDQRDGSCLIDLSSSNSSSAYESEEHAPPQESGALANYYNQYEHDQSIERISTAVPIESCPPASFDRNENIKLLLGFAGVVFTTAIPWGQSLRVSKECYHNYACATPFLGLTAYNKIISNSGYVILGLMFVVFSRCRKPPTMSNYGNGFYWTFHLEQFQGMSLAAQGIMSGVYHLCPNSRSYNLDTLFIVMTCCFAIMKLYSNRNAFIPTSDVYKAISSITVANFVIPMIGDLKWKIIIGIICCVHMFVVVYAVSKVRCGHQLELSKVVLSLAYVARSISLRSSIMVFVILSVNFIITACFFSGYGIHTNQFLLTVSVANLAMYAIYYIRMKISNNETVNFAVKLMFLCSIVFWVVSFGFFFQTNYDWTLTHAQSREMNRDCIVMDFFDYHDLWHIFSAFAAFSGLVALSFLDDPQRAIPLVNLAKF